jgi:hypothetical protein
VFYNAECFNVLNHEMGGEGYQEELVLDVYRFPEKLESLVIEILNLVPAVPWEGVTACLACKNVARVA